MKTLQFHAYAETYPLLEGDEYEAFKADILARGFAEKVKYRVIDGTEQGLDGRNRERAGADLGIPAPRERVDIADADVEVYIDSLNLHRRHLTNEQQQKRREDRIARVAEKRKAGMSQRQIADTEGISRAQVREDLEVATGQGCPVEPPDGKVTGKDDRTRTATPARPKETDKPMSVESPPKPSRYPDLCQRCQRIGTPSCDACKKKYPPSGVNGELEKPAAKEKPAAPKAESPPKAKPEKPPYNDKLVVSAFAHLLEKLDDRRETYGEHDDYRSCRDLVNDAREVFTRWQGSTEGMTQAETQQALFDNFYAAYPKKTHGEEALKAWKKLSPDAALVKTMLEAIKAWEKTEKWQEKDGQFIPNPATWLNGKRWNDALPKVPKTAKELAEEGVRKAREKKTAKSNTH